MGDALGLSLVHVNRTLKKLRGEGLIKLNKTQLDILNWEGLKEAGDFDAGYLHLKPQDTAHAGNGQSAQASN